MKVPHIRALICALAISAVACTSMRNAFTSSGDVDLGYYPVVTLSSEDMNLLRGMSDANIIGHLSEMDSIEVAAADTVMRISKSDDILDFAKLLRMHHMQDRSQLKDLAARTNITPTIDVTKFRKSAVMALLDTVRKGQDMMIEPNFIRSQIALHAHALAELEVLDDVTQNREVRNHLVTAMGVMRDHLARAHQIAIARGYEKRP